MPPCYRRRRWCCPHHLRQERRDASPLAHCRVHRTRHHRAEHYDRPPPQRHHSHRCRRRSQSEAASAAGAGSMRAAYALLDRLNIVLDTAPCADRASPAVAPACSPALVGAESVCAASVSEAASEAFARAAAPAADHGSSDGPATLHAMRRGEAPTRSPSPPPACRRTHSEAEAEAEPESGAAAGPRDATPWRPPRWSRGRKTEHAKRASHGQGRKRAREAGDSTEIMGQRVCCVRTCTYTYARTGVRARMYM